MTTTRLIWSLMLLALIGCGNRTKSDSWITYIQQKLRKEKIAVENPTGGPHARKDLLNRYDQSGNLTHETVNGMERQYSYNSSGRLVGKTVQGNQTSFVYDTEGNKIATLLPNGKSIFYLSHHIRTVSHSGSTPVPLFAYEEGESTENGEMNFFIRDHLGSILGISGKGAQDTLPFGTHFYSVGETPENGFAGQRVQTNVLDLEARQMELGSAVMLQPDLYAESGLSVRDFHRYAYVKSNPINYSDPTGFSPCLHNHSGLCDEDPPPGFTPTVHVRADRRQPDPYIYESNDALSDPMGSRRPLSAKEQLIQDLADREGGGWRQTLGTAWAPIETAISQKMEAAHIAAIGIDFTGRSEPIPIAGVGCEKGFSAAVSPARGQSLDGYSYEHGRAMAYVDMGGLGGFDTVGHEWVTRDSMTYTYLTSGGDISIPNIIIPPGIPVGWFTGELSFAGAIENQNPSAITLNFGQKIGIGGLTGTASLFVTCNLNK